MNGIVIAIVLLLTVTPSISFSYDAPASPELQAKVIETEVDSCELETTSDLPLEIPPATLVVQASGCCQVGNDCSDLNKVDCEKVGTYYEGKKCNRPCPPRDGCCK